MTITPEQVTLDNGMRCVAVCAEDKSIDVLVPEGWKVTAMTTSSEIRLDIDVKPLPPGPDGPPGFLVAKAVPKGAPYSFHAIAVCPECRQNPCTCAAREPEARLHVGPAMGTGERAMLQREGARFARESEAAGRRFVRVLAPYFAGGFSPENLEAVVSLFVGYLSVLSAAMPGVDMAEATRSMFGTFAIGAPPAIVDEIIGRIVAELGVAPQGERSTSGPLS